MTAVAVFSTNQSVHIIADTLVTGPRRRNLTSLDYETLSTGIKIDGCEAEFTEGHLKIWVIKPELVIGFSGDVQAATNTLRTLRSFCDISTFLNFEEFKTFLEGALFPTIHPVSAEFCFCGFLDAGDEITKFFIDFKRNQSPELIYTSDVSQIFAIGSGAKELIEPIGRLQQPAVFTDLEMIFSFVADHMYLKQFVGTGDIVRKHFSGGAITGVFRFSGKTQFHTGRTILIFVNIGGKEFESNFVMLPTIYKTWEENGNVFSSSTVTETEGLFQRIIMASNDISKPVLWDEKKLTPEMLTFQSNQIIVLLTPTMSTEFPAVVRINNAFKAFDEIIEDGRLVQWRVERRLAEEVGKRIFITSEGVIAMHQEADKAKIHVLQRDIPELLKTGSPDKIIDAYTMIGMCYLGLASVENIESHISSALSSYLSAWAYAERSGQPMTDRVFNVQQLLEDMGKNLENQTVERILKDNGNLYQQFIKRNGL